MDPSLITAGLSIGQALFGKKKKASVDPGAVQMPDYGSFATPDQAATRSQVRNFYSDRAQGKGVGYTPDDMGTMRADAIDQSTHEGNELTRRAMAGRQARQGAPGQGMSTGATDYLREQSIGQTLASRSKAMRDVNISNAALKQSEIENAGQGLAGVTAEDDQQQMMAYYAALQRATNQQNEANSVAKLNAASGANEEDIYSTLGQKYAPSIGSALFPQIFRKAA